MCIIVGPGGYQKSEMIIWKTEIEAEHKSKINIDSTKEMFSYKMSHFRSPARLGKGIRSLKLLPW